MNYMVSSSIIEREERTRGRSNSMFEVLRRRILNYKDYICEIKKWHPVGKEQQRRKEYK